MVKPEQNLLSVTGLTSSAVSAVRPGENGFQFVNPSDFPLQKGSQKAGVRAWRNFLSFPSALFAHRDGEMVFNSLTPPTSLCKRGAKRQGFVPGGISWVFPSALFVDWDGEMVFVSLTPPTPLCKRRAKNRGSCLEGFPEFPLRFSFGRF